MVVILISPSSEWSQLVFNSVSLVVYKDRPKLKSEQKDLGKVVQTWRVHRRYIAIALPGQRGSNNMAPVGFDKAQMRELSGDQRATSQQLLFQIFLSQFTVATITLQIADILEETSTERNPPRGLYTLSVLSPRYWLKTGNDDCTVPSAECLVTINHFPKRSLPFYPPRRVIIIAILDWNIWVQYLAQSYTQ